MKNRLPRRQELLVFLALSVVCTVIVKVTGKYDVGLAFMGAPVFLVAALMGLRRHAAVTAGAAAEAAPAEAPTSSDESAV